MTSRAKRRKDAKRKASAEACMTCGEGHHAWEASAFIVNDLQKRTGLTSPLHDDVIGDAAYHILIDSYRVQATAGDREIEEIITNIGSAMAHMIAAVNDRGRQKWQDEGVVMFWKAIYDANGPGVYEFEIGPSGALSH